MEPASAETGLPPARRETRRKDPGNKLADTKTAATSSARVAGAAGTDSARGRSAGRAQPSPLRMDEILMDGESVEVLRHLGESPLAWLAARADKAGRPLIDRAQFLAGERLRLDFTRAGLMPRVTADWSAVPGSGSGGRLAFADQVIAAKARFNRALAAVGPELSGVLTDVCCFLKGLEEVERDHRWPARTGKVVLGLALDRLAGHYGFRKEATGRARAPMRAWHAEASGMEE